MGGRDGGESAPGRRGGRGNVKRGHGNLNVFAAVFTTSF